MLQFYLTIEIWQWILRELHKAPLILCWDEWWVTWNLLPRIFQHVNRTTTPCNVYVCCYCCNINSRLTQANCVYHLRCHKSYKQEITLWAACPRGHQVADLHRHWQLVRFTSGRRRVWSAGIFISVTAYVCHTVAAWRHFCQMNAFSYNLILS